MIQYIAENISIPVLSIQKINRWIKETAAEYGKKTGEIAYVFCSDERILEINKQYLKHDYYTDIITFDYSEGKLISGDIFISLETVKSNAEDLGVSFDKELQRILIHGILHLCGQDDKTPELRIEMTSKENLAIDNLEKHD
jgi:rRNA maturation RNase YbeY